MAGKNKPSDVPPPQDDAIYRVKHISRSAWEEGALSLPGLTPRLTREEEPAFDDVAMDMAMTGEIPLELIRAMLRQQEGRLQAENQKRVKGPTGGGMIFPEEIVPAKAQATAEAPGPEEIERAKEELRAMKAKSRLPREDEAQEPRKPGGRKRPPRARGGEPPEAADEEEETGGPSLTGTIGLLAYMQEGGPGFWDDAVPLYHIPLLGILRAIYRSLYYYGLRFVRPLRIAGRLILPQLAKPLLTLWHLLRALLIALHYLTVGRLIRAFRAVQATHAKRIAVRKGRRVGLRTMLRGVLVDYRPVLRPAANVLMPVAGLLALMFMVQWLFGSTYALRVTFNGKQLGYISNESVFLQARAAANDNIAPRPESVEDAPAGETEEKPAPYAHFSIEKVNPEEIKSMDILTNELLNNTAGDMTSAYGLRIDGRLFATIKNSTDADIVLDSIKKQKAAEQHADSSAYVAFVQDVELVPGHYPASQLVDAQTLLAMLSKPQMEETVVKVQAGDTPLSLQYRYNLASVEELYALNPWMREPGAGLHVGDDVKVRAEVTRLEVKIIKNEVRYEEVPYETRDTDNYEEYKNVVRIRIKGVPGRDKITERVTYINGVRTGSPEVISRAREAEPVTERRDIGRKDPVVSLPSGEKVKLNVSTSGYQWPVQGCTRVSSPYGYRGRSFHKGIDIADGNTNGKIVVASKGGVVELVQLGGTSYGNMILINHGNGVKTRYAHLMSGSISVRQGQTVSIGQPIARVGSTGNSTGPHLHFEVIVNGSTQNPRNFVSP